MFTAGVGSAAVSTQPDLYSGNSLAVQLNAMPCDLLEVVVTFQATGSFNWYLQGVGCTLVPLSSAPHVCHSTTPVQYTKTCYLIAGSSGTVTFSMSVQSISGSTPTVSNLMMFARKTGTMLPTPTTAPGYIGGQWIETLADVTAWYPTTNVKWVTGYKVRYAVSFISGAVESSKGPWCDWIDGTPWAWPTLNNIEAGSSLVQGRKIYRQFQGFEVECVGTINNNTDTQFGDTAL